MCRGGRTVTSSNMRNDPEANRSGRPPHVRCFRSVNSRRHRAGEPAPARHPDRRRRQQGNRWRVRSQSFPLAGIADDICPRTDVPKPCWHRSDGSRPTGDAETPLHRHARRYPQPSGRAVANATMAFFPPGPHPIWDDRRQATMNATTAPKRLLTQTWTHHDR
jgi:hypothetical protein